MTEDLASLSVDEKLELLRLLELRDRRQRANRLGSYKPYPKQMDFHAAGAAHRERLLTAGNQGHPMWFKVLTPAGWRPIGDLKPGDQVMAGNGEACVVEDVVDLGVRDIYEVSFDAGNVKVQCTDDHLWAVRSPQRDSYSVLSTVEVLQRKMKPRTPGCGVVQFERQELPVDPYLLGVLIGDGSFTNSAVQVSSNDEFILNEVRRLIPDTCDLVKRQGTRESDWHIRTRHEGRGRRNELLDSLADLGLRGKRSEDKGVPKQYLLAGPSQRLDLLRGLMDADGSVRREGGRATFWTSSPRLGEDVAFLCRSLGGAARMSVRSRLAYKHPRTGEIRPSLPSYVVEIRMPSEAVPFRLPRKVEAAQRLGCRSKSFDHIWEGATVVGREEARCIRVSHPSRLYICEGFIVTHNCGKTLASAAELAYHLTGLYPADWKGRKFPRAIRAMAGSESAELTRKGLQRLLLGPPENENEWGTGLVPKSHLKGWSRKPGVPDAVASITVTNEYGGESVLQFSSYEQGRGKWQADTLDVVALDEEPPLDIYTEALTRTNASGGMVWLTFTPLLGMSEVVRRFLQEKSPDRHVTTMTIDDVGHISAELRAQIIASYPEHEREARTRGIPMMGEGMVFPIAESRIRIEPFPIPPHWARIGGLDIGFTHPSAFVCLAHDRDSDTVFVYDAWKESKKSAAEHSMMIIGRGHAKMPWAWPHDAAAHDKGAGQQIIKQYKDYGVNTLPERAQFAPSTDGKAGGNSVEAGIAVMYERMQTGRLKIFSTLDVLFEEIRQYHRKDGVIVKEYDDTVCALRYGVMMLRKAQTPVEYDGSRNLLMASNAPQFQIYDPAVNW